MTKSLTKNQTSRIDRSADESHLKLRGESDVIRLRNPTEDKRAFRRMLTSADLVGRTSAILDVAMLCAVEGAQCKTRELR